MRIGNEVGEIVGFSEFVDFDAGIDSKVLLQLRQSGCRWYEAEDATTGIVEVLPGHTGNLGTNLAYIEFQAEIISGTIEKFTAILLNYPVVCEDDRAKYEEDILKPVSQWFAAYMKWTKDATDEMSERLKAGEA